MPHRSDHHCAMPATTNTATMSSNHSTMPAASHAGAPAVDGCAASSRRIQLRRVRGWRLPTGAVKVARPSRWGNPYRVGIEAATAVEAVERFRAYVLAMPDAERAAYLAPLRGRALACFCRLDQPCHADVLLEFTDAGRTVLLTCACRWRWRSTEDPDEAVCPSCGRVAAVAISASYAGRPNGGGICGTDPHTRQAI